MYDHRYEVLIIKEISKLQVRSKMHSGTNHFPSVVENGVKLNRKTSKRHKSGVLAIKCFPRDNYSSGLNHFLLKLHNFSHFGLPKFVYKLGQSCELFFLGLGVPSGTKCFLSCTQRHPPGFPRVSPPLLEQQRFLCPI